MPSLALAFFSVVAVPIVLLIGCGEGAITKCSSAEACFPWNVASGPHCVRGQRISLRFSTDIAPENYYTLFNSTRPTLMKTVSYGFCPVVDELQAFNLSVAPLLGVLQVTNLNISNSSTYLRVNQSALSFSSKVTEGYLYAHGFGTTDSQNQPNISTSTGAVMIFANDSSRCFGGVLVSTFLVLAVSLDKGRFKYEATGANPSGSMFLSTCSGGLCTLDRSQSCIGNHLSSNCARCYQDTRLLEDAKVQIWTSYYGNDVNGRLLFSGSNNPLNFQQFSSDGLWNNLKDSFNRVGEEQGNLQDLPGEVNFPDPEGSGPG